MESGNCKVSFILNRGIVTEVTPWSRDALQACARSGSGNETIMSERGRPWYLKVRIQYTRIRCSTAQGVKVLKKLTRSGLMKMKF